MSELHLYRTDSLRSDGRSILYYDPVPPGGAPPVHRSERPDPEEVLERGPEMRYNPLLDDYTVCAGFRMDRPQLPPRDDCPLCVGGYEAPEEYSVMVFDNRFPSLVLDPAPPTAGADPVTEVRPGVGKCEVVCYTPDHNRALADMPVDQIHNLVYAWCDRFADLTALDPIESVLIFENRGEAVGVTLHHPHGQIYALPIVPPRLLAEKRSARRAHDEGRCVFCDVIEGEKRSGIRVLAETDRFLAAIPYFARLPHEVHVYAKRHGCRSMLDFEAEEKRELAGMLSLVCSKYDAVFAQPMPYMMLFHQLATANEGFHFHAEFYPMQRAATKLKYAASVETGGGLWLNDSYPERMIETLRAVGPQEVVLPSDTILGMRRV